MEVDRCRFKRRIANVSDIITSVLLKKIEKAHLWFDGYMYKHASSTTTYSYKTGRHTSDLCYSINGINQWKHADKIGNDVSEYILCDDTFTFICKSISRENKMKSFCKLDLNNLRYTEVYELENGQKRVDLREWGREGDT